MKPELLSAIQANARPLIERIRDERIVVWGAGELGCWLMQELGARGVAFVDTNPTKRGVTIANRPVHVPEDLEGLEFDEVWISVLSDSAGIEEVLDARCIPNRLAFPGGKRLQVQDELGRTFAFLNLQEFQGRDVLEVGSGGQLFLALTALHLGANTVMVSDVGPLGGTLKGRESEWRGFLAHLEAAYPMGHDPDRLLAKLQIEQRPLDAANLPYRDASFDVIMNTGVMEHVDDPAGAIHEFARVLRSRGVALCLAIGIHDHRSNNPRAEFTPWSFLSLNAEEWDRLGGGAYHQNRWRAVDFTRCFASAGFQILQAQATQDARLTPAEMECFTPQFRDCYSLEELSELDLFLAAELSQ